ncbi:unnamed protein product [Staurois parvus]|uniref:Uncharacterized protein n=1 Tax=Staurois parvus TaxID=386267 RepID=A0ABN9ART4_9NEOB|nr:unnamed protein product [Staurois parvus]
MGPPNDPGPSGSARVSKWSVRHYLITHYYCIIICGYYYYLCSSATPLDLYF